MKIAFIGTGVMGKPMAGHLAEAGHQVTVYNRTREKALSCEFAERVADTIADAVKDAEVVFSIVGLVKDVEEVYLSPQGILANAPKGCIVCDMTTSSPSLAVKIAREAETRGVHALDAPVTGGDKGAIEGKLSIMVGGPREIYEKLLPCFKAMGSTITYMGENGNGQHAKLANQITIAGALASCAEAIRYAQTHGLDTEAMLQVINNGSAASWQSQNNGPKMLNGDYAPGFRIRHLIKDLRLGQEEKGELDLPLAAKVLHELETLEKRDLGDQGTQAIIEYYK